MAEGAEHHLAPGGIEALDPGGGEVEERRTAKAGAGVEPERRTHGVGGVDAERGGAEGAGAAGLDQRGASAQPARPRQDRERAEAGPARRQAGAHAARVGIEGDGAEQGAAALRDEHRSGPSPGGDIAGAAAVGGPGGAGLEAVELGERLVDHAGERRRLAGTQRPDPRGGCDRQDGLLGLPGPPNVGPVRPPGKLQGCQNGFPASAAAWLRARPQSSSRSSSSRSIRRRSR